MTASLLTSGGVCLLKVPLPSRAFLNSFHAACAVLCRASESTQWTMRLTSGQPARSEARGARLFRRWCRESNKAGEPFPLLLATCPRHAPNSPSNPGKVVLTHHCSKSLVDFSEPSPRSWQGWELGTRVLRGFWPAVARKQKINFRAPLEA